MDSDQSFNLLEQEKTKVQLVKELESLRKRIAELEQDTERQRAEEALQHTLERLQQLSHHVLEMQENEYKSIS